MVILDSKTTETIESDIHETSNETAYITRNRYESTILSLLIIEKLMERDYFLDAEQALEMGLVDKVLTSRKEQEDAMEPLKGKGKDDEGGGTDEGGGGNPSTNPSPS